MISEELCIFEYALKELFAGEDGELLCWWLIGVVRGGNIKIESD